MVKLLLIQVGGDGKVYEGRGWNKHGSHAIPYNGKSIGICFLGNFGGTLIVYRIFPYFNILLFQFHHLLQASFKLQKI